MRVALRAAFFHAQEAKQARSWQALDQLCGLRSGRCLAQRGQQAGHGARVVEAWRARRRG
jgi:hypothetical protein